MTQYFIPYDINHKHTCFTSYANVIANHVNINTLFTGKEWSFVHFVYHANKFEHFHSSFFFKLAQITCGLTRVIQDKKAVAWFPVLRPCSDKNFHELCLNSFYKYPNFVELGVVSKFV